MVWNDGEKWYWAFLRFWLGLISIRLCSGDLWKAYNESWDRLFRWFWTSAAVAAVVVLIQGMWRLWKKRKHGLGSRSKPSALVED